MVLASSGVTVVDEYNGASSKLTCDFELMTVSNRRSREDVRGGRGGLAGPSPLAYSWRKEVQAFKEVASSVSPMEGLLEASSGDRAIIQPGYIYTRTSKRRLGR